MNLIILLYKFTNNILSENFKQSLTGLCQGALSRREILNYENGLKHTLFARDNAYLEPAGRPVSKHYIMIIIIIQKVLYIIILYGPHICGLHGLERITKHRIN